MYYGKKIVCFLACFSQEWFNGIFYSAYNWGTDVAVFKFLDRYGIYTPLMYFTLAGTLYK